jgi:GTP-binding protein HflX
VTLIDRTFRERIVLVGMAVWPHTLDEVEASLDELALLVGTAGADVAARVVQRRDAPDPARRRSCTRSRSLSTRTPSSSTMS